MPVRPEPEAAPIARPAAPHASARKAAPNPMRVAGVRAQIQAASDTPRMPARAAPADPAHANPPRMIAAAIAARIPRPAPPAPRRARERRGEERDAGEEQEPAERVRRDERGRGAPGSEERASLLGVRDRVRDLLRDARDFGAQPQGLRDAEDGERQRRGCERGAHFGRGCAVARQPADARSRPSTRPTRRSRA